MVPYMFANTLPSGTAMQDPAQMQRMTDLRMIILENERAGRPRHHSIDPEELKLMVDALRQKRAPLASKGGKAGAASRRKTRGPSELDDKLKKLGMDFD
jgi:hypothetical protein